MNGADTGALYENPLTYCQSDGLHPQPLQGVLIRSMSGRPSGDVGHSSPVPTE